MVSAQTSSGTEPEGSQARQSVASYRYPEWPCEGFGRIKSKNSSGPRQRPLAGPDNAVLTRNNSVRFREGQEKETDLRAWGLRRLQYARDGRQKCRTDCISPEEYTRLLSSSLGNTRRIMLSSCGLASCSRVPGKRVIHETTRTGTTDQQLVRIQSGLETSGYAPMWRYKQ